MASNPHASAAPTEEEDFRLCDHPNCEALGEFPAPKSPSRLNERYWFCLDHIREYNARWNFCEGMSDEEVEARTREDTVWHRPTWPLGQGRRLSEEVLRAEALAFGDLGSEKKRRETPNENQPGHTKQERRALADLNLKGPVSFQEIRTRYISLVKRLHPDTNGGSQTTEDRLKIINRAYAYLRERHG
ncbi:MAG: J domain-containing protein [Pseudomonadota bacterium]